MCWWVEVHVEEGEEVSEQYNTSTIGFYDRPIIYIQDGQIINIDDLEVVEFEDVPVKKPKAQPKPVKEVHHHYHTEVKEPKPPPNNWKAEHWGLAFECLLIFGIIITVLCSIRFTNEDDANDEHNQEIVKENKDHKQLKKYNRSTEKYTNGNRCGGCGSRFMVGKKCLYCGGRV